MTDRRRHQTPFALGLDTSSARVSSRQLRLASAMAWTTHRHIGWSWWRAAVLGVKRSGGILVAPWDVRWVLGRREDLLSESEEERAD